VTKPVFKPNPHGQSQYSSYKPRYNVGSYSGAGGKKYGYRAPGYGTNFGTSFGGGVGRYTGSISKKKLGLGVAAGFLGGAALGVGVGAAATLATYSVYHRYHEFRRMLHVNNPLNYQWNDNYYQNYYSQNICLFGCPAYSHCEWGFCECNGGYVKSYGRCVLAGTPRTPRPANFEPFNIDCSGSANYTQSVADTCAVHDINLVCNTNLTVGDQGKCQCRNDMRWNTEAGECQIYMDVDCSKLSYNSTVAPTVLAAAEKATAEIGANPVNATAQPTDRTQTKEESLATSLLGRIDPKTATKEELTEAFCRDIDAYSLEFQEQKDERPSTSCSKVPETACAVAYDSSRCYGGWKLVIPEGTLRFRYWSSYWKYRNDMDTIGVRSGCTFTGYSDSSYNGNSVTIRGEQWDRWVVFANEAQYRHMDEDIESIACHCGFSQ